MPLSSRVRSRGSQLLTSLYGRKFVTQNVKDPSYRAASAPEASQETIVQDENSADDLRSSELRYRRLFETARDGILILDIVHGRITDSNPFMSELLGYSRGELLGKELWEIGVLKDKLASKAAFQQLKKDGYVRYENLPLWNYKNELREVEFVSNVYRENQNTVVQCNIRDITERKQSDERLAVVAAKNEHIVEVLQRSMLQTISPRKFAGILVETLYQAALNEAEVGGDFFDAFSFGGDKEALVIGDVSGKGLLAASRTAEVKYALRAFLHEYCSPEIALAHLNDFIFETHRLDNENQEMFIVVSLIVIENSSGRALFVSAGAEATIILRADGTSEQVIATGTPLGIIPSAEYMVQSTILRYGDTVLMVTDGITEARKGNMFLGVDGLQSLVEQMGSSISLSTLGAAVYLGAKSFANGDIRDDVCMLLARKL